MKIKQLNKILVTIGGLLFIGFGVFHSTFFRFFGKSPDFALISPFLQKIVIMLDLGLIVFFLSQGIIMLLFRNEVLTTKLGKAWLFASSAFFLIRGMAEFAFEKCVIPLVLTMVVCSIIYLPPALNKR